jgi:hypothetical protein
MKPISFSEDSTYEVGPKIRYFHEIHGLITVFTRARRWCLFYFRLISYKNCYPIFLRTI